METNTGVDGVRGLFVHYTSKRNQRLGNNCTQQLFVTVSRDKRISSCPSASALVSLSVRRKQRNPPLDGLRDYIACFEILFILFGPPRV